MKYVVGYAAHARGREALALGVDLARAMDASLEVVLVVRTRNSGYQDLLEQRAKEWLAEAASLVPETVRASYRMHRSASPAQGLMEVAELVQAGAVLVGGSSSSTWRWHGIGSTANALLHRARTPVVMAPREYPGGLPVTRIDCAVSPDSDSTALVDEAIATQNRTGVPVRLVGLLQTQDGQARTASERALTRFIAESTVRPENPQEIDVVVGAGADIPEAVEAIEWEPGSLLMTGSSRLAQEGELFLPSTTAKILTRLPIPVVVVPRDYSPGRGDSAARPWTGQLVQVPASEGPTS